MNEIIEIIPNTHTIIKINEDEQNFKIMLNEITELKNIIKNLNNIVINQNELINNNDKNLNDINNKISKLDNNIKPNIVYDYIFPICKMVGLGILKSSTITLPYILYKILK